MKAFLAAVPIAFVLAVTACGGSEAVNDDAENAEGLDQVVAEANATAQAIHNQADTTPPAPVTNQEEPAVVPPPPGAIIPAQYHGRWGLVPADCTSTRGDNKGLITVGDTRIRFYESTATLTRQRPAKAASFAGEFVFTGEGQRWQKVMTLTRTGKRLTRTENGRTYRYTRC